MSPGSPGLIRCEPCQVGSASRLLARSQHPPARRQRRDAAWTHRARNTDACRSNRAGTVCYASLTPQNPALSGKVAARRAAMSADRGSFGEVLRRVRSGAALSQEVLAERAGLSKRGISDLERGARRAPRLETVRLLADALGLGEPERADLLAAARPEASPSVSSADAGTSPLLALPRPPTRLIGRESELAAVCALLAQEHVRLVTLTGPGGTGKTRLALAVAADATVCYPDGIVFVDLSALTDPARVLPTMASVLGVRERSDEPLPQSLARYLGDRRLLLLLD